MSFNKRSWQASNFDDKIGEVDTYRRMDDDIRHYKPIVEGNVMYGGRIFWMTAPNYLSDSGAAPNDAETDWVITTTRNVDVSSALPTSWSDIKGVMVHVALRSEIPGPKVTATTYMNHKLRYSLKYNETPGDYNFLVGIYAQSQSTDAENIMMKYGNGAIVPCPLTFYQGKPYITYGVDTGFYNMKAVVDTYKIFSYMFIVGYLM